MSPNEKEIIAVAEKERKPSDIIFTVPNILSFFRILLIVPFMVMFFLNKVMIAFVCIIVSGISDALDGFLARRLHQTTKLGKLLDPIADKLTLLAVMVCLGFRIPEIFPLTVVLIIKDVLMLCGGSYLVKKGITPPQAKWYGKTATIIFYIAIVSVVLYRELLGYRMEKLTVILFVLTASAMIFALLNYMWLFVLLIKGRKTTGNQIEKP